MNDEPNLPASNDISGLPSKDESSEATVPGQEADYFASETLVYQSLRGMAPATLALERGKYGDHRRALEMMRAKAEIDVLYAGIEERKRDSSEARVGQICALTICLASILAGAVTAIYGHDWAGSAIGVGGIGGIVTTFILGRKGHNNPRAVEKPQPKLRRKLSGSRSRLPAGRT
jgi:hypothetical protein